jgi:hypothetical protein
MISLRSDAVRSYLAETVRLWLGLPASARDAVPAIPERLARLLLRCEEYEIKHRDQWDCWEHGFSENYRTGRLWVPEIDLWVAERRRELERDLPLEPLWPDGRRFAVCVSHDVDEMARQASSAQVIRSVRGALAGPRLPGRRAALLRIAEAAAMVARGFYWGISLAPGTSDAFDQCLALECERQVTSSYFFTVYPSTRLSKYDCVYALEDRFVFRGKTRTAAEIVRTLAEEGHDVGLHGSYYSATEDGVLAFERRRIEEATGLRIRTTRQHYLHWDIRCTPRLQNEAGFAADSTLGFNRNIGFRAGTSLPYHLFDLERGEVFDLVEVPLVVQDGALLAGSGLELDANLARATMTQIIDAVAAVGGVLTLLFHPYGLKPPDFGALYEWCLREVQNRGAWVASLAAVDAWWRDRERRLTVELG